MSFFQKIANRILPPKADIGFFQERHAETKELVNSSTRLFQAFFAVMLWFTTKWSFYNVFNDEHFDVNKAATVVMIYLLNIIAILAPKMIKNSEVVKSLLAAAKGIGQTEKPKQE